MKYVQINIRKTSSMVSPDQLGLPQGVGSQLTLLKLPDFFLLGPPESMIRTATIAVVRR